MQTTYKEMDSTMLSVPNAARPQLHRLMLMLVLAIAGLTVLLSTASPAAADDAPEFGLSSFRALIEDEHGVPYPTAQAGSHPFSAAARMTFNHTVTGVDSRKTVENVRSITTDLPVGFYGDPQSIPTCKQQQMVERKCPVESQVGVVDVDINVNASSPTNRTGVYNIVPDDGAAAMFGFTLSGIGNVYLPASVRSDSDYGVTVTAPNVSGNPDVQAIDLELWGVPADPRHDADRHDCTVLVGGLPGCVFGATTTAPLVPFLTNPSFCQPEHDVTRVTIDSWQHPRQFLSYTDPAPLVTGCDALTFEPEVEIAPTVLTPDAPTGLNVDLAFPQDVDPDGLSTPPLKKAVVTLPEGMTINPAGANGLAACSDEDLNLKSKQDVTCPNASKVGTVTAKSPVLEETLSGGVYIRSQNSDDPESGEMFRLALLLENEERGLSIRLPGQVRVNKQSGRVETTFDNNPQLPVEKINLKFKDGPRAPLATPPTCGPKTIDTVLTSWGGQTATMQSTFNVTCGPNPGTFQPGFQAGTTTPVAGASSLFNLVVARQDGEKELKAIKSVRLPEGLLGNVSSVPLCGQVQADVGACAEDSRVGRVQVAAGAGSNPLWVPLAGKEPTAVYLSGPYRGAPYSLSIVVPAQAGPFDLGKVVVRSALHVDERTAAITSGVDETRLIEPDGMVTQVLPEALPRILKGVVLNQREIRLIMDREDFMINPTDCSMQEISAEIYSYGDDRADVGNRFRASDCALLGFKPRFTARILDKGRKSTVRSWHPRTRFTVVPRKGDANIGGARVALPSSTILDQSNIGTTCTRTQMAERNCPEKSVVGYAKAWSPLLRKAVEGPVYLAANGGVRPLPDLAAVLDGEIRVVLQGEISTLRSGGKARLQNTFRVVPDAPVNRFILTMRGGKNRGLLVNSTDLCRSSEKGVAVFTGQNNRRSRSALRLTPSFKGCGKVRRQAARKVAKRKAAARKAARRMAARS